MAAQCPTRTVERCYTALCTPPSAVLGPTTCISPNGPAHHVCINLDLTLHGPAPSRRGTLAAALSNGAEGESDGYAEPEATQMQRCVKADECGRGLGLQTEIKITTRAFGWRVQYIVEASVVNRLRMQTHADMTVPNIIVHPHSRRARGQGNHNVPLKGSGAPEREATEFRSSQPQPPGVPPLLPKPLFLNNGRSPENNGNNTWCCLGKGTVHALQYARRGALLQKSGKTCSRFY